MNTINLPRRIVLSLSFIIIAALSLTLVKPWQARGQGSNTVTTVSAASYTPGLAPEAIAAAFGTKLATQIKSADSLPLPTNLVGTTVKVNGELAPLFFVSPMQVNYLIPSSAAPGNAQVVITSGDGTVSNGTVQISNAAPAIFTADASGAGVPAASLLRVAANGDQTYDPIAQTVNNIIVPRPILIGPPGETDFLVLFLCGVRRTPLNKVKVIIAGNELSPSYADFAPGFVGLDQINVEVPRSLSGRGRVKLRVRADAVTSNFTEIEFGGADLRAGSATVVTTSANPAVTGQSITFTAQVSPAAGTGTPAGTVIFKDTFNSTTVILGTANLNAGLAMLTASLPSVGAHQIAVEYEGDNNFKASAAALSNPQNINKAATSLTLTSSKNPSAAGEEVAFTVRATVNAPGAGTPSGGIVVTDNGVTINSKSLDASGQATVTVALVSTGAHAIAAIYAGDVNFNGSTGALSVSQNVAKAGAAILISSSANPSSRDQAITLTAEVRPVPLGTLTPTGVVQFKENNVLLGTPVTLINGRAAFSVSTLALGARSITAEYYGDPNFQPASSAAFTQTVGTAPVQITGIEHSAQVYAGDEITINGSGFTSNPEVKVIADDGNETTGQVVASSADQLRVRVPFGAGSGKVRVGESESPVRLEVGTSVSGFVQAFNGGARAPVAGLTITWTEPSGKNIPPATTNPDGSFVLKGVTPLQLPVFARIAIGAQAAGGISYPAQVRRMTPLAGRDNQYSGDGGLANIIEITPNSGPSTSLLADHAPASETLSAPAPASRAEIAGVITSGQVTFDTNNSTITFPGGGSDNLTLTVLDPGRVPVNLPPLPATARSYFSSTIAQITPFGATLAPGGKLTFPNSDGIPAGTPVRVFRFDQTTNSQTLGQFIDIGAATVSADGAKIETAANAVTQTSYYFVSRQWPAATIIGLVSDADGRAVRRAVVNARGQSVFTGNNGGFVLPNVPVITPDGLNDQVTIEVSFVRADGTVDRTARTVVISTTCPQNTCAIAGNFALPSQNANRPPLIIAPRSLAVTEGDARNFAVVISDPDGLPLASVNLDGTAKSFASLLNQNTQSALLHLEPGANSAGNYTLTITATDKRGLPTVHAISVVVLRASDNALFARYLSVTTNEDAPSAITLSALNPAGGALSYEKLSDPAHGVLTGLAPNFTYTPAPNFNGFDSFSYRVRSGARESNVAVVFIAVNPVNDAPVLSVTGTPSAIAGQTITLTLTATDVDAGQTYRFASPNLPFGASLVPIGPMSAQFIWTPTFTQSGNFPISFTVTDDGAPPLSDAKTVTITVATAKWAKTSGPEGGRITDLIAVGSQVYAITKSIRNLTPTGFYASGNGGVSWSRPDLGGLLPFDLFTVGGRAYAIAGRDGTATNVYLISNGGQSFVPTTGFFSFNLQAVAASSSKVFVGVAAFSATTPAVDAYTLSSDGLRWTRVASGFAGNSVGGLAVKETVVAGIRQTKVFASVGEFGTAAAKGMFVSNDEGQSWTEINTGITNKNIYTVAVSGSQVYAAATRPFSGGNPPIGVFVTSTDGANWNLMNNGLTETYVSRLEVIGSQVYALTGIGAFVTGNGGQNWTRLSNTGFPVDGVQASAVGGGRIYVGLFSGGVAATSNGGQSWTQLTSGIVGSYVTNFVAKGNKIFAGIWGNVLHVSSNGGQSWTKTSIGETSSFIQPLAVKGNKIFAGYFAGVYVSDDDGLTWTRFTNGLPSDSIYSMTVSGDKLLVGTASHGVYQSDNDGQNWGSTDLTSGDIQSLLAIGTKVFAGTRNGEVYRSLNGGVNWQKVSAGLPNAADNTVLALATRGSKVFAGVQSRTSGNGVYVTANDGQSWTKLSVPTTSFIESVVVSGQIVFASTSSNGVFTSNDDGQSWRAFNPGLPFDIYSNGTFYHLIAELAVIGDSVYAGTDGDGVLRLTNNAQTWNENNTGLANKFTNAVIVNNGKYYAGTLGNGVFRSTNQGQNWQPLPNGLPANANVQALAVAGNNLFAGLFGNSAGNGVYRSSNEGANWTLSGLATQNINALTGNNGLIFAATDAVVFRSPTGSDGWTNAGLSNQRIVSLSFIGSRLFAGTYGGGIYLSTDNGANWALTGSSSNGLGNPYVTALSVGADGATLFAGTDGGGIYRSLNGGATWAAANNDLPLTLNVYAFAVSGAKLYAGSVYGVFLSEDNGASWKQVNAGLLDIYVTSLAVDGKSLIAGTRVGGVFTSQIP